ncbi:hypothetical protein [Actinomadura geliboluensis]|uniref:hypothetical protein n=1 Tax=Actinomadura geliboluensis TaxID=882440 RepID=UPI00371B4D1F
MKGRAGKVLEQVELAALRWRTLWGARVRVLALDLLAVMLESMGWRCVRLYRLEVLPVPVLWVHGGDPDAGLAVTLVATSGGWHYIDAGNRKERLLGLYSDRAGAAAAVDARLKWQLTTDTAPEGEAAASAEATARGVCAR